MAHRVSPNSDTVDNNSDNTILTSYVESNIDYGIVVDTLSIEIAAFNGYIETIKFLITYLEKDANFEMDKLIKSIMKYSVIGGHVNIADFILTSYGHLFKNDALLLEINMNRAVKNGHVEVLQYLIENTPITPSSKTIVIAAKHGRREVLDYLIKFGEQHSVMDPAVDNNEALFIAAQNGHLNIIKYLIELSTTYPDINPAVDNNVILLQAATYGYLNIIKYLVSIMPRFPDISLTSHNNEVIMAAIKYDHLHIVKYLISLKPRFREINIIDRDNLIMNHASIRMKGYINRLRGGE